MKFEEIIKDRSEFKIGFLGGSLTEGFGASSRKFRYSSLFVSMLNKRFPKTHFTEINAAIGGTNSSLGLFKLQREILDKGADMLVIEYAANDHTMGDGSYIYYESLIRITKRFNPDMPIICIFAAPYSKENGTPKLVQTEKQIAEYYKIPWCDTGVEIQQKINDYGGDRTFFTIDDGHPSDYGYKVYVDCLMRDIIPADFEFIFPEKPFTNFEFKNPKMLTAEEIPHNDDWVVSARTLPDSDMHYLCSDKIGATLEIEFEGTCFGLYARFEKSCGNADIFIDGKLFHRQNFFDKYCVDFDRSFQTIFTDSLPYGKHTVKLVIADTNEEKSEGHATRLIAFLVA